MTQHFLCNREYNVLYAYRIVSKVENAFSTVDTAFAMIASSIGHKFPINAQPVSKRQTQL